MIYRCLFAVYFFSVVALPFLWVEVKMVLGSVLLVFGLLTDQYDEVTPGYIVRSILLVVISAAYVGIPLVSEEAYPGSAHYTIPLYVIFPIFWLAFLPLLNDKMLQLLSHTIHIAGWVVWTYAMALFFNRYGVFPFGVPNIYAQVGAMYGVDKENIALASPTVSALLLLAPILTFLYLRKANLLRLLMLVLFWAGILVLGRRSAVIGLLVTFALYLVAATALKIKLRSLVSAVASVFAVVLVVWFANLGNVQHIVTNRIQETARVAQTIALWDGFLQSPILGHGLGVPASFVRSPDKPWRYEMVIPASLFRYGLLGFGALCIIIGVPLAGCVVAFRRELPMAEQALMCGSLAMIACYTLNPVFDTFDTLWVLFLPLLVYSRIRMRKGAKTISLAHLRERFLGTMRQSQPS